MNKDGMKETQTEHFADATAEEYEAMKDVILEKQSLKNMLNEVIDTYCNRMRICVENEQNTWAKIKTRLKEQWPADGDVGFGQDGKLSRKPESRSE